MSPQRSPKNSAFTVLHSVLTYSVFLVGEASTGGLPKRDANKGIDEAQLAEELLNKYKCTIC